MEKESALTKTLICLVRMNALIQDRFFYNKINDKIKNLADSYIKFSISRKDNTLEYNTNYDLLSFRIEDILESVQDLQYLNVLKPSILLLQVQKNLLVLKTEIIDNKKSVLGKSAESVKVDNKNEDKVEVEVSKKVIRKTSRLTENKQRILNFIKTYPNTRTKDIIQEFNVVSDRTVKRSLTDLLQAGLIKKRVDNKAVYYYISE